MTMEPLTDREREINEMQFFGEIRKKRRYFYNDVERVLGEIRQSHSRDGIDKWEDSEL